MSSCKNIPIVYDNTSAIKPISSHKCNLEEILFSACEINIILHNLKNKLTIQVHSCGTEILPPTILVFVFKPQPERNDFRRQYTHVTIWPKVMCH